MAAEFRWKDSQRPHAGFELGAVAGVVGCIGSVMLPLTLFGMWVAAVGVFRAGPREWFQAAGAAVIAAGFVCFFAVLIGGVPAAIVGGLLGRYLWARPIGVAEVTVAFGVTFAGVGLGALVAGGSFEQALIAMPVLGVGGAGSGLAYFVRRRPPPLQTRSRG